MSYLNHAHPTCTRERYSHAMAGFVQWLGAHWDELKASAPHEAAAYGAQLRAGGQHLRVPDGLGLLHSGFVRALRYAEEVGALRQEHAEHWRATSWQVMLRLAEKQTRIVADERPVLRFLTTLGELLTQGKLRLEAVRGESAETGETQTQAARFIGAPEGDLVGYFDARYIYLLPSAAYHTVAKFARDEGRQFSVKEHALRRALVEEGVLEAEDGHTALRISIGNRQQRLL